MEYRAVTEYLCVTRLLEVPESAILTGLESAELLLEERNTSGRCG